MGKKHTWGKTSSRRQERKSDARDIKKDLRGGQGENGAIRNNNVEILATREKGK
jgi:hypothetical protein